MDNDTRDTQGIAVIAFMVVLGCFVCACWVTICCLRVQNMLKMRKMMRVPPPPPPKRERHPKLHMKSSKKKKHHKLRQAKITPVSPTEGNLAWQRECNEMRHNLVKNFDTPETDDDEPKPAKRRRKHRMLSPQQREEEYRKQEKAKEKDVNRTLFLHCEGARDAGAVRGELELAQDAAAEAQTERREIRANAARLKRNRRNVIDDSDMLTLEDA